MTVVAASPSSYPVDIDVQPQLMDRNRLTVAFRIVLAIPHLLIVGGPIGLGFGLGSGGDFGYWGNFGGNGVLGLAAGVCAFIAWFAILFASNHPRGLWDFCHLYLRWRVRAMAYVALLRDEYPPFGDAEYPVTVTVTYPEGPRDKLSVGLRIIFAIPHLIIVSLLSFAWAITSIVAWFAILFTGAYPAGLYKFAVNVMRWSVRLEAYMLLMRDEYPPFSLEG
jgi:hypothetical protein